MALAKAFAQQLAAIQKLFGWMQHIFMLPFDLRGPQRRMFILEVWASACCGSRFSWLLKTYWKSTKTLGVYGTHAVEGTGGGSLALGWEDWVLFFILLLTSSVSQFIFLSFSYMLRVQHQAEWVLLCPLKMRFELCSSWSRRDPRNIHTLMLMPGGRTCARPRCPKHKQTMPSKGPCCVLVHPCMPKWSTRLRVTFSSLGYYGVWLVWSALPQHGSWTLGLSRMLTASAAVSACFFAVFLALHCKSKPNEAIIWIIYHLLRWRSPRPRLQVHTGEHHRIPAVLWMPLQQDCLQIL